MMHTQTDQDVQQSAQVVDKDRKADGRDNVRRLLWGRIDEAGLVRPRGQSVDDQAALRVRLCDRLSYMDPANLSTLAEIIIENAQGRATPRSTIWGEAMIRTYGKALQHPPAMEFDIVRSWLASIEGPPAIAGGFDVELFRFLARRGVPPLAYDVHTIKSDAAAATHRITLVADRIRRNAADQVDRIWLEAYSRDRMRVGRIVADGQAKRDAVSA